MAVDVLKRAVLLLACSAILLDMPQSMANEEIECPAIEEDANAAEWWQVERTDGGHIATLKDSMDVDLVAVDLDMDGPSTPVLLGWEVLAQYDGSIGLLHYYSGATGSHVSANITRYVVINLDQSTLLANIDASVHLAGIRWIEHDDGTFEEEEIVECQLTELDWQSDRLIYSDGESVDSLPLF